MNIEKNDSCLSNGSKKLPILYVEKKLAEDLVKTRIKEDRKKINEINEMNEKNNDLNVNDNIPVKSNKSIHRKKSQTIKSKME